MLSTLELEKYSILDIIHSSRHSLVIRAERKTDGVRVILKKPSTDHPSLVDIAGINSEYEYLKRLSHPSIIKALDFIHHEIQWMLVLEDIQGITLSSFINHHPLPLDQFFKIALQLIKVILYVHSQGIIHNDIKPDNILISSDEQIKLIDFSLATHDVLEELETNISRDIMGTLEYLSPEQTGRTNRPVDFRSDLYSLGVTFFEMLTGDLPFKSQDPLDIIYAHLATPAPDPSRLHSEIPKQVSQIVLKLLSKDPKDRYQTAYGLLQDFEKCSQQWAMTKQIRPFLLGQDDTPTQLQISSKLYGRDANISALKNFIDSIYSPQSQIVLMSGYAGIGKTSLIKEIQTYLILKRCLFLKGKYELMEHTVPYSGLIRAIKQFCTDLLGESEEVISAIKQDILNSIGSQGSVIIRLVPEVEWIIGPQPPVPETSYTEAQQRFDSTIKKFLQALATTTKPLVLFLEGLMWSDIASLTFIETIIPQLHNCLFIGSYRSNEIHAGHPLANMIQHLKEKKIHFSELYIQPLNVKDIQELLKDTFATSFTGDLAQLIMQKTEGNPFFIKELLRYLDKNNLVKYNVDQHHWTWDIEGIRELNITQNVVELMMEKISLLSQDTRNCLSIAAAIGGEFELKALAQILQQSEQVVAQLLEDAIKYELITQPRKNQQRLTLLSLGLTPQKPFIYKFCHDRIQQAAYELIPKNDLPQLHYSIAKMGHALNLEDLVNHYNLSYPLITDPSDKLKVIELNIQLAEKAKTSNAHQAAIEYLQAAERLLAPDFNWDNNPDLLYKFTREKAESLYLVSQFEKADYLFTHILSKVQRRDLQASIYSLKSELYCRHDRLKAIKEANKGLALYGIKFPEKIQDRHILWEIVKVKFLTLTHDIHKLQPMNDPDALIITELLQTIFIEAYLINPRLFMMVCSKGIEMFLKYGYTNSRMSIFIASFLFIAIQNYKQARRFYDYGLDLKERFGVGDDWGYVLTIKGAFIDHWFHPFSKNIESLEEAQKLTSESGSLFWFAASSLMLGCCYLRTSLFLDKLETFNDAFEQEVKQKKLTGFNELAMVLREIYKALNGHGTFNQEIIDAQLASITTAANESIVHGALGLLCIYYYLTHQYELAQKYAKNRYTIRDSTRCSIIADLYDVFCFLTFAKQNVYTHEMKVLEKYAKSYAQQNPENFLGGYHLILAEKHRILGDFVQAFEYYDKAIGFFQDRKWHHYAAVANELASTAYQQKNRLTLARFYLREAHYQYGLWGARAITTQMEKRQPELTLDRSRPLADMMTSSSPHRSSTAPGDSEGLIDILSVLKVSQAFSEETATEHLLHQIMLAILANTGAQRGVILIEKRAKLVVVAETMQKGEGLETITKEIPFREFHSLPQSLLAYVDKTHETILVNSPDAPFYNDPYFSSGHVQAALCLPIGQKGKENGVLYLEHNLNRHAFNMNELKALQLLISQAAIALENASLFAAYKRFVPSEFLEQLSRGNVLNINVGDQINKNMTVLYSNIRNFTILSETLTPNAAFELINQFLEISTPILHKRGGFIDKYNGGSLIALFTSPEEAVLAGLEVLFALEQLNKTRSSRGDTPIQIGIGINTGLLSLGIIGEEKHIGSSILGETVNIALQLEGLNKSYGTNILLSGATRALLTPIGGYTIERVGNTQLKGKRKAVEVWKIEPTQH